MATYLESGKGSTGPENSRKLGVWILVEISLICARRFASQKGEERGGKGNGRILHAVLPNFPHRNVSERAEVGKAQFPRRNRAFSIASGLCIYTHSLPYVCTYPYPRSYLRTPFFRKQFALNMWSATKSILRLALRIQRLLQIDAQLFPDRPQLLHVLIVLAFILDFGFDTYVEPLCQSFARTEG